MTPSEKLQSLIDYEINFTITHFWDGGIDWVLGDKINGYLATGNEEHIDDAVEELWKAALDQYPGFDSPTQ